MGNRLLDKVVLITGGTSGIGLEIAKHSISQGANVVISGRRVNEGKKIINELGEKCLFIKCDVLCEDHICALVKETVAHYGKIDVMFNNAGAPDFVHCMARARQKAWTWLSGSRSASRGRSKGRGKGSRPRPRKGGPDRGLGPGP